MDLYSDLILDLYRNPLHKAALVRYDFHHVEHNPLCGDTVELFLSYDKTGTITEVGWLGNGCAISQAAASLTADYVIGKSITAVQKIKSETILAMLGLEKLNPTRLRCALLALENLKNLSQ